jgi:phosphoribosylanthranilate isomerase
MFAIDINSKFEISPGVKDLKKIGVMLDGVRSIHP